MSSAPKSRWAEDDEETQAHIEQRKREKEAKRRAKEERRRKLEEEERRKISGGTTAANGDGDRDRPAKRRRLSGDDTQGEGGGEAQKPSRLLRFSAPGWGPCRHVDNFERLNAIEEGSYGWVSRARETATGEIVAIKKLKMENAQDGFPITGLREIQTLFHARHPHVVGLREVVMGDKMDE